MKERMLKLGHLVLCRNEWGVLMVLWLHRGGWSLLMQWRRWRLPEFFWPGKVGFYPVPLEDLDGDS